MKAKFGLILGLSLLAGSVLAQAPAPAPAPAAVPPVPVNDKYTVNKTWAQVPADLPWNQSTTNIAPDGKGNVIVFVRAAPFFRIFTREGKFVRAWGDGDLFNEPHSLLFDREGNLWTTDAMAHVVYKFDATGKLLITLGKKGTAGDNASTDLFNRPNAVAIAPNGDIYVSDGYNNARVVHFDKSGKFVKVIGGVKGTAPGQLQLPHGVVVDSRGRVLVGDSDNRRVTVFDKDGKFVETWPFVTRGGMLITADDTVYISDVNSGGISIVKDGKLIDAIGGLGRPHGIGLDTDGTLYASDSLNRTVMKITKK